MSGPQAAKIEKRLHAMFKKEKFKITTSINIKRTDFLDFELDLDTGKVRPWRKPNNDPKYINVNSSHPAINIKCLPNMIENRLAGLSSSEEEFNNVKRPYEDALKDAGYEETSLKYSKKIEGGVKRIRRRKVLWFNPPYSSQVTSNVTQIFNSLIEKHFKKGTFLAKLFNKNNLKLSYSTTANLGQVISGHNKKILANHNNIIVEDEPTCNCQKGVDSCPVEGSCLNMDVIYEATVTATGKNERRYLGSTATTFKIRHGNYKSDFKLSKRRTATKLSGYVWLLKDKSIEPNVKFRLIDKAPSYTPTAGRCLLCLTEKLLIMQADPKVYLNDRSEMMAKCRHRNKYLLSNIK